jgi:FkbM family methyltransferase
LGLDHPLDVEVFGVRARLHPFGNVSANRLLFTPQYFDPEERGVFAERAKRSSGEFVFLDIGANIGGWSLYMASVLGTRARILSFEPQPGICEQLQFNAALNPGANIKVFAVALSDRDGEAEFALSATNRGESSLRPKREGGARVAVPARTLLGVLRDEAILHVHGMKIDVEGAEDLVLAPFLRDAQDSLLPEMVTMERTQARWGSDLIAQMKARGYTIARTCRRNLVLERQA